MTSCRWGSGRTIARAGGGRVSRPDPSRSTKSNVCNFCEQCKKPFERDMITGCCENLHPTLNFQRDDRLFCRRQGDAAVRVLPQAFQYGHAHTTRGLNPNNSYQNCYYNCFLKAPSAESLTTVLNLFAECVQPSRPHGPEARGVTGLPTPRRTPPFESHVDCR